MSDIRDKSLMVKCECSCEVIEFQNWSDDKQFYVTLWKSGFSRPMSLYQRIRWAVRVIVTGDPWGDQIILSSANAKKISKFISENL